MASEQIELTLPGVATAGSLTLFRYSGYDVPFWVRPNTRPGRWHRRGDPPTQYWSMSPDAAWAELIRAEGLVSEADLELVRMPLWVCRVAMVGLVDLTKAAVQLSNGVTDDDLVADGWGACQALGRRLRRSHPGVIAPCAALDGHANVTFFGPRRAIDWRERPALARAVPATVVAIGRPPVGLVARVRRAGGDDRPAQPLF